MEDIKEYIRLMRVHHYIKNLLVFAPLACGRQLFLLNKFMGAFAGFMAFCMISSVVYIINDIRDQEKDRLHPTKCNRPIASGKVTPNKALILAAMLLIVTVFLEYQVFDIVSCGLLILYLFINLAYSLGLKDLPLLDVAVLTTGFLIRVMYGALITDIEISNWLYLTVITLAFYFSLGKRRNELEQMSFGGETRKVLKHYSIGFLDKNMYMCLALANVFYALWCMDTVTYSRYGVSMVFTVPVVLLITMKYSMDVEGEEAEGDPVEVLLHDRVLLILCFSYLLMMFAILYL